MYALGTSRRAIFQSWLCWLLPDSFCLSLPQHPPHGTLKSFPRGAPLLPFTRLGSKMAHLSSQGPTSRPLGLAPCGEMRGPPIHPLTAH